MTKINAQIPYAYVKFSKKPEKRLSSLDISETDFYIEYQSKKKATVHLELFKDDNSFGTAHQTVKSKNVSITKLNLIQRPGISLETGRGYTIRLRLFEGEKYDMEKLLSETVINDVSLTRLIYTTKL